jgi:hypothetical protein
MLVVSAGFEKQVQMPHEEFRPTSLALNGSSCFPWLEEGPLTSSADMVRRWSRVWNDGATQEGFAAKRRAGCCSFNSELLPGELIENLGPRIKLDGMKQEKGIILHMTDFLCRLLRNMHSS